MPAIRMMKLASGPDGTKHPGKVYDVSAEEGTSLVACDAAAWVHPPLVESAVQSAPETAVGAGQRTRTKPRPPANIPDAAASPAASASPDIPATE